jgi:hypothetical protein
MFSDETNIIRQLQSVKDNKAFFDLFKKKYNEIRNIFLSYSDKRVSHDLLSMRQTMIDPIMDELVSTFPIKVQPTSHFILLYYHFIVVNKSFVPPS